MMQYAPAQKKSGGFGETLRVIIEALLIALIIRTFAFQPFNIPSGSLVPNLLVGDYLFVSKYSYGYSKHSFPFSILPIKGRIFGREPQRGDIAVFKLPKDGETDYIKRVIGIPGDKVQVLDGLLHINGKPVQKVADGFWEEKDAFGRTARMPRFKETLSNGVTYTVIEKDGNRGYWDNTVEYTVPLGHFFMMGDNRDNSTDSRSLNDVGYVPLENFVGKAQMIFFSADGPSGNRYPSENIVSDIAGRVVSVFANWAEADIRWNRIFQSVH